MAVFLFGAGGVLVAAGLAAALAAAVTGRPAPVNLLVLLCAGNLMAGIGLTLSRNWPGAALNFIAVAVNAWLWFRRRKRRNRALKALGSKARARLTVMLRKVREFFVPRPVLRPVPGGAR